MTAPLRPDDLAAAKLVQQLDDEQTPPGKHVALNPVYAEVEAGNPTISHEELRRAMTEQAAPAMPPEAGS